MTILSQPDPTADIACTLPVNDMRGRLVALQALIGNRFRSAAHVDGRLRVVIDRGYGGDGGDLEAELVQWAAAEKSCCAFLGFAVESQDAAVILEIAAPAGAEPALEGIEWIIRAAAQPVAAG